MNGVFIDRKVTAIIIDNAANIIVAVRLLQWKHLPYLTKVVNN